MQYHLETLYQSPILKILLVRVWSKHQDEIDQETGQPWAPYDGMAVLLVRGPICEVKGIMNLPVGGFDLLRGPIASELKLTHLVGERWKDKQKKFVSIPTRQIGWDEVTL